jgi:hypothetical protein
MPDHRPGGPLDIRFDVEDGRVVLRLSDAEHGGGMNLHFPSAAWAQVWLDELATQLADIEAEQVFG